MRSGSGVRAASASSAPPSPRSVRPAGCRPRASSRSSVWANVASSRTRSSSATAVSGSSRRRRGAGAAGGVGAGGGRWGPAGRWRAQAAEREAGEVAEREEALLGAVVQLAADAAALVVGGLDHTGARSGDLGLAGAQEGLVAAALDLGGGAGGEDAQRGDLVLARVEMAVREDAEVAEARTVDAAKGDAEVALEVVAVDERSGAEALAGTVGQRHDVVVGELAGRAGQLVLRALRQPCPTPRPRGDHPGAL